MQCLCIVNWIFILGNLQPVITSPMVSLSGTPTGHVCPGEVITFTCVTNGSSSHAWRSDEYIGEGGIQLEFASYDSPGDIHSNPASSADTFATLIAVENRTLQSQLHITVAADRSNFTIISCMNVDADLVKNTSFQVLDKPGIPEKLLLFRRSDSCGRENRCSVFVQLNPPTNINEDDVTHYILDHKFGRDTITSTSHEFLIPNCSVELDIEVSAVSRCRSLGNSVTESVPLLPPDNSLQGGIAPESNQDRTGAKTNSNVAIGLSVGVGGPIILIFSVIICGITIVSCRKLKKKPLLHNRRNRNILLHNQKGENFPDTAESESDYQKLKDELMELKKKIENLEIRLDEKIKQQGLY